MSSESVQEVEIPKQIGRYQVETELDRGGMATIYVCHDPRVGRKVAVKVLPHALLHDPMFRTRFIREARTVATLEHPFIVPVHDFGEENGQPYLVMRLMLGGSLADRLTKGAVPFPEIARILHRINNALAIAHRQGIIHRDLKPGNILFDQYNNAFLSDFGIARLTSNTESNLTNTGSAVGTPGYMSPEQIQGRPVDGRSDIYALGVLLFEMLTGQKPFHADTPAMVIVKQMTETVPNVCNLLPNLPPVYDELIRRLTATNRDSRPATTLDVTKMIVAVASWSKNQTKPLTPPTGTSRPASSTPRPTPKTQRPTSDTPSTPRPATKTPRPSTNTPRETDQRPRTPPPKAKDEPISTPHNLPPPILPLLEDLPEPVQHVPAVPTYQETHSTTSISCPTCSNSIQLTSTENSVQCNHCKNSTALTGHLCPYCNTYHDDKNSFCDSCGASLTRLCTNCNTINWSGAERCETCNSSLDIFENLRTHDRRVALDKRDERLTQIRQANQLELEASERRMAELRGDQAKLLKRAKRRRFWRSVTLLIIFVILAALTYFFYTIFI
ncbi:MAG: protein kinase [Chloroflexi bacterium]|nr:protein kinase [Chloroflexota bacterium]